MTESNRPAERSTPVSRIFQTRDINIPLATPSSKKKIRSFLQATPLKRHRSPAADKPPTKEPFKVTELATPSQKFRIYRDKSSTTTLPTNNTATTTASSALKTPVSELKHTKSWKIPTTENTNTPTTKKITRDTFAQDFKIRGKPSTSLPFAFNVPTVSDSPLLHDIEMPIVKLDQWYKIHQVSILTRDPIEDAHVVLEASAFNDMLTLVKVEDAQGQIDQVLLLNYKQSVATMSKFQNVKKGDKVALIEGFDILGETKMYHNWKLQV